MTTNPERPVGEARTGFCPTCDDGGPCFVPGHPRPAVEGGDEVERLTVEEAVAWLQDRHDAGECAGGRDIAALLLRLERERDAALGKYDECCKFRRSLIARLGAKAYPTSHTEGKMSERKTDGPVDYSETELGLLEIDRVAVLVFARAPLNSEFYRAVDRVRKAIAAELSLASAAKRSEGDNG